MLTRLRAIFAGELEDQIANVKQQIERLTAVSSTAAEQRQAAGELLRAVHSLKGAAGSVGLTAPEAVCHDLEDRLGAAGLPEKLSDVTRIAEDVRGALFHLEEWSRASARAADPALAAAPPDSLSLPRAASSARAPSPPTLPPPSDPALLSGQQVPSQQASNIRVSLGKLDELLASVNDWIVRLQAPHRADRLEELLSALEAVATRGPLTIDKNRLRDLVIHLRSEHRQALTSQKRWSDGLLMHGSEIARELRGLRLQKVSELAEGLERAVQESAKGEGKLAQFRFSGAEARADHQVVERLREPLLQLVRNAVAHGLEVPAERLAAGKTAVGSVELSISAHGADLDIVVSDDGKGINIEKLRQVAEQRGQHLGASPSSAELLDLLCTPGLSTRSTTDTQAGRGIGMDLVKDRIERLQGRIRLESRQGLGTRIEVQVPVDLSMVEVLLVSTGGKSFAIPSTAIRAIQRVRAVAVVYVEGRTFLRHEGELIPLAHLLSTFGANPPSKLEALTPSVVLEAGGKRAAIFVEDLVSVADHVAKPLAERARVPLASAAVLLSGQRLAPLLNAQALCQIVSSCNLATPFGDDMEKPQAKVLIVDDSVTTRQLVRIILEAAGYHVDSEADAEQAWRRLSESERFDAVITDIEMPAMSGLDLLGLIRASVRLHDLPVILVSALAEDDNRRRALDLGADAYLVKSRFDQQKLLSTLEELLG